MIELTILYNIFPTLRFSSQHFRLCFFCSATSPGHHPAVYTAHPSRNHLSSQLKKWQSRRNQVSMELTGVTLLSVRYLLSPDVQPFTYLRSNRRYHEHGQSVLCYHPYLTLTDNFHRFWGSHHGYLVCMCFSILEYTSIHG